VGQVPGTQGGAELS
jgi:hypothetical protein